MELVAVGLAANISQFVQQAFEIIRKLREIRESSDGWTQHNQLLAEDLQFIEDIRQSMQTTRTTKAGKRIVTLSTQCVDDATELLGILQEIKDTVAKSKNRAERAVRALLETWKKSRRIEKIENRLKCRDEQLKAAIGQDTYDCIQEVQQAVQQRGDRIDSSLSTIIRDLTMQRLKHEQSSSEVQEALRQQQIRHDAQATKINNNVKGLNNKLDDASDTQHAEARRHALLQSLDFETRTSRRRGVADAFEGTAQWILEPPNPNESREGDNFIEWAEGSSSVYWISGKAGSGKSTLMAYIIDDPRTEKALLSWSQPHELCMLSFYFWRAGSEMQQSSIGMLQTLLYQICSKYPGAADTVANAFDQRTITHGWTAQPLQRALKFAVSALPHVRFCIFIDGLDEYTGHYGQLLDLVLELQQTASAKICLSSRPEPVIEPRLRSEKHLRMQDYNYEDIALFVTKTLSTIEPLPKPAPSYMESLPDLIIRHASGVFLWAIIVSHDVMRGVFCGDDDTMLRQRVQRAPEDLVNLFGQMFDKVDPLHKETLAFYFQALALAAERRSYICLPDVTDLSGHTSSYEDVIGQLERTRTSILAQSAGLLEFDPTDIPHVRQSWNGASDWVQPDWTATESPYPPRKHYDHLIEYPRYVGLEAHRLVWVHRSAYEFVLPPDNQPGPLAQYSDRNGVSRTLCKNMIRNLMFAPTWLSRNNKLATVRRYERWYQSLCTASVNDQSESVTAMRTASRRLHNHELSLVMSAGLIDTMQFGEECKMVLLLDYILSVLGSRVVETVLVNVLEALEQAPDTSIVEYSILLSAILTASAYSNKDVRASYAYIALDRLESELLRKVSATQVNSIDEVTVLMATSRRARGVLQPTITFRMPAHMYGLGAGVVSIMMASMNQALYWATKCRIAEMEVTSLCQRFQITCATLELTSEHVSMSLGLSGRTLVHLWRVHEASHSHSDNNRTSVASCTDCCTIPRGRCELLWLPDKLPEGHLVNLEEDRAGIIVLELDEIVADYIVDCFHSVRKSNGGLGRLDGLYDVTSVQERIFQVIEANDSLSSTEMSHARACVSKDLQCMELKVPW